MIIQKSTPPFYNKNLVANQFKLEVAKKIGPFNRETEKWIEVSIIHYSYINENPIFDRNVLEVLGLLGVSFSRLILIEFAHENKNLTQLVEYDRFVNSFTGLGRSVFDEFELTQYILLGKGEKASSLTSYTKEMIGRQFTGALVLCYDYQSVKSLIRKIIDSRTSKSEVDIDFKTLLQEFSQRKKLGLPIYNLLRATGPDHQKEYEFKVSTRDGKSATSRGGSKSEASRNAAAEYVKKYLPNLLKNKGSYHSKPGVQTKQIIFPEHGQFVDSIVQKFNCPKENKWLFSQSLTHKSFINELNQTNIGNSKKLAQLGAKVLDVLFTYIPANLATNNQLSSSSLTQFKSYLSIENIFCECFDLLRLEQGLLLGKGEKTTFTSNPLNKVEIFQAVVGAAFLSHGSWESFINNLPLELEEWINDKIEILKNQDVKDSTSQLQEILQAVKLDKNISYDVIEISHPREYKARVTIKSSATSKKIMLSSDKSFPSQKAATRYISSLIVKAFHVVNSELGMQSAEDFLRNNSLLHFAEFLLLHELSSHVGRADAVRWHEFGILGSRYLSQGKHYEFKLWAMAAGKIIRNTKIDMEKISHSIQFYSYIPSVTEQLQHKEYIETINRFVNNLSPDTNQEDIRNSVEFKRIINLSKIYKLSSQDWTDININLLQEDLGLLRRDRHPKIIFDSHVSNFVFSEKAGTYATILFETIELIEDSLTQKENSSISIFFEVDTENSDLLIKFNVENANKLGHAILETINSSILWDYLQKETPITEIKALESSVLIKTKIFTNDNSFASQVLNTYRIKKSLSKAESQMSSQLLHDLKNHLIAYQITLDMAGNDRTSILKAKFEASQHLDNSISICRSLETVSKTMTPVIIEPIIIGEFIRLFIAEKIASVPLSIRFETPKTTEASIVFTSKNFLKSILENLTKNAVEAMPNGGEIRIDWLFDDDTRLLMIDFSDTGIGIEPETLEKIQLGKLINSSKHKGSGIGILSIQSMLERLGGSCTIKSQKEIGTQWSIVLPSMTPIENIEGEYKDDSSNNFSTNEVELK